MSECARDHWPSLICPSRKGLGQQYDVATIWNALTPNLQGAALDAGLLNVTALGLLVACAVIYVDHWNGPRVGAVLGLAVAAVGVAVTVAAGALGWMLVQNYHIGIRLTPKQAEDETTVQRAPPLTIVRHHQAS